jgi:hypothetical protein
MGPGEGTAAAQQDQGVQDRDALRLHDLFR